MKPKSNKRSQGAAVVTNRLDTPTTRSDKPLVRHDDVYFHFLASDEESTLKGTVLIRRDEMVLDISDPAGASPYLIVGCNEGQFFRGMNTAHRPSAFVEAKWADLGTQFVGVWTEDGYDYYFSFRLPKATL